MLILIKILVVLIGILLILRHVALGLFHNNNLHLKKGGRILLIVIGFLLITSGIEFLLTKFRNRGLVMYAWREAPIGGIWLRLYNDDKFKLGHLPESVAIAGSYKIKGDTLFLEGNKPIELLNSASKTSFIITKNRLLEINSTKIGALDISKNELRK